MIGRWKDCLHFLRTLEGLRALNVDEDVLVLKDKGKKMFTVKGSYAYFSNEGQQDSNWLWKQIW